MYNFCNSEKGVSGITGIILYMSIAVGVLFAVFVLLGYADEASDLFFGTETDALTEAIKCSYYSCTEGCVAAIDMVDDHYFDCSEYCFSVPEEFKDGDKICGFSAFQYPVELEVTEPKLYSDEFGNIDFKCIIPTDTGTTLNIWEFLVDMMSPITMMISAAEVVPNYDLLRLDTDLIYEPEDRVECTVSRVITFDSLDVFEPVGGSYWYIYSGSADVDLIEIDISHFGLVTALATRPYIVMQDNQEYQIELIANEWTRLNFGDVGDVGIRAVYNDGGRVGPSGLYRLNVICPSGVRELREVESFPYYDDCSDGYLFCDGKLSVMCIEADSVDELVFYIGYGDINSVRSVTLFEHSNFEGDYVKLTDSASSIASDLNNQISSLTIPSGWLVTLYDSENYNGQSITISGDSSYLVEDGNIFDIFNTIYTSSIKFDNSGCSATVYDSENYGGSSVVIENDVPVLDDIGWNDRIDSIRVEDGCKAILYVDTMFNGRSVVISGDSPNVHFDNKASSVQISIPTYSVRIIVSNGGKTDVYNNDEFMETVEGPSESTIQFIANDVVTFASEPNYGYVLDSYCGENQENCCSPAEDELCTATFERIVNQNGVMYVNFAPA